MPHFPPFCPPPFARSRLATAIALAAICAACGTGDAPDPSQAPRGDAAAPPALAAGRTAALAPIETAELVVRESQPPQYAVRIVSGLPSGCAKFERVDVVRDGYVVNVSVWNALPSDSQVACTMIYGTTEHTAELGSDFSRGEAYAVHVNGERKLTLTPR